MALARSFLVASGRAWFAAPMIEWASIREAVRPCGCRGGRDQTSREMSFRAARVGANEGPRIGLVNHLVPHEELLTDARALAGEIAAGDAPTIAALM